MNVEQHAEAITAAMDAADTGFKMELTRLVDGISTYTFQCNGLTQDFDCLDDGYEWVREQKLAAKSKAILTAVEAAMVAGAEAMREAAAVGWAWNEAGWSGKEVKSCIRALDPTAIVKGVGNG